MPPFSTTPKEAPPQRTVTSLNQQSNKAQAARASAIAMLTTPPKTAAQSAPEAQGDLPVANPSQISPEEASAVLPKSAESQGQSDSIEATSPSTDEDSTDAVEAPKVETPAEQPLSQQYAVLARKEKALRAKVQAQESAYKAREAALQAREQQLQAKDTEYQSKYISKDALLQDPWSILQDNGITYDQLTERALSHQNQDPVTKAAIARLEAQVKQQAEQAESSRRANEEQQKRAYSQAVENIRNEAKNLVSKDPNYETIKETGSVNDVVELIEETFKADGILLSVEEAAQAVEEHLIQESEKLFRLKKLQQRFAASKSQANNSTPNKVEEPKKSQEIKTLTNNLATTRKLSPRERAILAFNENQMKKRS